MEASCTIGMGQEHLKDKMVYNKQFNNNSDVGHQKSRPHSLGIESAVVDKGETIQGIAQKRFSCLEGKALFESQGAGKLSKGHDNKRYMCNRTVASSSNPVGKESVSSSSSSATSSTDQTKQARPNGTKTNGSYQKAEVLEEGRLSKSDNAVTSATLDTVSPTVVNKTFKTSSSDGGSFNATEYKGERTYF